MIVKRIASAAVLAGMYVVLVASPAAAHPITGGSASPLQIAITVVGTLLALAGVGAAMVATGDSKRFKGDTRKLRRGGLALALVGFMVFIFGPDLFEPAQIPCEDRPATQASIAITSPAAQEVFTSQDVPLELDLEGGKVASLASTKNKEDEGHLHISIDGRLATMTGDAEQVLQVPPGDHELEVEYVANDHAPFCKRVNDRVRFTVEDSPS